MDHHIIGQIVKDSFEKAKTTSPKHSINALAHGIEEQSDPRISYKTSVRAYKRYLKQDKTIGAPAADSINSFCIYLGYKDYQDYVLKNDLNRKDNLSDPIDPKSKLQEKIVLEEEEKTLDLIQDPKKVRQNDNRHLQEKNTRWRLWSMVIVLMGLGSYLTLQLIDLNENEVNEDKCMVWVIDHYEDIDCTLERHPELGTKVEKLVEERKANMKKVKVTASFHFFSEETGTPLIWYYKTKSGTLEYFTSPGLHPIYGETLKKITPRIIQKYVPVHQMDKESFL